jgi:hypothetical protein
MLFMEWACSNFKHTCEENLMFSSLSNYLLYEDEVAVPGFSDTVCR